MNSKNIVALEDKSLCMVCLKEKATHEYYVSGRGYGSSFDSDSTHWQCCDKCHKDEYYTWANEQPSTDNYYEEYKHEEEILEFIHNLPLQSQELFFNTFNSSSQYPMDAQYWIDYELGKLTMKTVDEVEEYCKNEKKRLEDMLEYAQTRLVELENNKKEYFEKYRY